jgi:hypothetical protein
MPHRVMELSVRARSLSLAAFNAGGAKADISRMSGSRHCDERHDYDISLIWCGVAPDSYRFLCTGSVKRRNIPGTNDGGMHAGIR